MSSMKVLNMAGAEVGTVELNDEIFGITPNPVAVHEVVKNHLANCRQGTQSALTRAEVSAIFYRLLSDDARGVYTTSIHNFADVHNSWASTEIATLANAGILQGYTDGTFRPNAAITRAEFAAIAARFDKLSGGTKSFSDVPTDHWAYAAITSAAEKGWVTGYSDGTFRPNNAITRAEVVKITNAVLDRTCDKDYVSGNLSKLTSYNDLTSAYWAYYDILEASNAHDYKVVNDVETWVSLK